MKNTLKAILSILIGTAMCSVPMTAFAEYEDWSEATNWAFGRYSNDSFTVTADTFQYSTSVYGIKLENELLNANLMFMVSGIARNEDESIDYLVITSVNQDYGSRFVTWFTADDKDLENYDAEALQVGDFLRYDKYAATAGIPPWLGPDGGKIEYLGHGTEIFGEEFQKVIRHEWISEPGGVPSPVKNTNFDVIIGDATEDEKVNILDVITINRSLVGKTSLNSYAQYVADVNGDGIIDGMDSMNIMRYIVGLIDSPDAQ